MIYAKVDVKLRDHVRAHRAGAAMSTWLWALLYVREQETDGEIPKLALRLAWAGEKDARKHAEILVSVGLWEKSPEGWRICRYDAKNDTKAAIEANRKKVRDRVTAHRRNASCNALHTPSVTDSTVTTVPGSRSRSDCDSGSPEGVQGEPTALTFEVGRDVELRPEPAPPTTATPPPWFATAAETASMAVGEVSELPARWASYRSSRSRKGWSMGHEDAVGWLCDVVRSERAKAASAREYSGPRLAFARPDEPPPAPYYRPLPRRTDEAERASPEVAREAARGLLGALGS